MDLGFSDSGHSFDVGATARAALAATPAFTAPRRDAKLTDEELANALIAGEPFAARLAIERFSPMVQGILRRGLGTDGDAEDAFQEVFLCLFRRIPTLRDPVSLRAFVLAIATNTLMHERRRRQKRSLFTSNDLAAAAAPSPDEPSASYALARLGKLLARLGERERRTFVLSVCEGCTALEAAAALGVSEPTARRALSYARSRIRTWAARDPFLLDYFATGVPLENEPAAAHI